MKQSLQLQLGQQLTMTPQLQQAIRMLQLSTLELQMEIQQALDSNMMLEEGEEYEQEFEEEAQAEEGLDGEELLEAAEGEEVAELSEELQQETLPDELVVDTAWDDVYDAVPSATPAASSSGEEEREFEYGDSSDEDLREHLLWQIQMSPIGEEDMLIAEAIIDAIDDDGFLTLPLEEILESLQPQLPDIELEEVVAVLRIVQNCDPLGVAARDLRECLLLQLRAYPEDPYWLEEARTLLDQHFELLAARDYTQLKRVMKLSEQDLTEVIQLIQGLNPRPGGQVAGGKTEYIVPDVVVTKTTKGWQVALNSDAAPKLRVNNFYAGLIKQTSGSDATTMKNHLQEARWFLKSLQSRHETLLKVARCIVERQRGFLEHGEEAMQPLILRDVAESVGMHESTISRVTTQKYMLTPRGVFEFKYFFSSHVSTSDGGAASATAIRALIRKLIGDENSTRPLSDSKIAKLLGEQGIQVARRTVAKYRESMTIPPSNERKRLM